MKFLNTKWYRKNKRNSCLFPAKKNNICYHFVNNNKNHLYYIKYIFILQIINIAVLEILGQYGQIPKSINERYREAATPHVAEEAPPCRVLGGTFGYFIQGLLGVVALIGLFFKFHIEKHDTTHVARNFTEWAFDASKQAIAAAVTHVFNILLAMIMAHIKISKDPSVHPDQCAWYFINFCIDTFFGIALVFFFVRTVETFAHECGYKTLAESGNYGSMENPSWKIFSIQLFVFLLITLLVKFILALLVWPLSGPLGRFGIWLFAPLRQSPELELVIVMVIGPCLMNVVGFWILDNILKKNEVINDPRKRNDEFEDSNHGIDSIEEEYEDNFIDDEEANLIVGYGISNAIGSGNTYGFGLNDSDILSEGNDDSSYVRNIDVSSSVNRGY